MKAKKYQIQVCEGVMDFLHGGGQHIDECYIPECGLFINGKASFLGKEEDRVPFGAEEIELDDFVSHAAIALVAALEKKSQNEDILRKKLGLKDGNG